ncbi:hypothetical protein [Bizionia sp.]|uniref:hypothetical protein n=1 Tax=Bizionia sp. TaxID=1954480 RepID=UPI003A8E7967
MKTDEQILQMKIQAINKLLNKYKLLEYKSDFFEVITHVIDNYRVLRKDMKSEMWIFKDVLIDLLLKVETIILKTANGTPNELIFKSKIEVVNKALHYSEIIGYHYCLIEVFHQINNQAPFLSSTKIDNTYTFTNLIFDFFSDVNSIKTQLFINS